MAGGTNYVSRTLVVLWETSDFSVISVLLRCTHRYMGKFVT